MNCIAISLYDKKRMYCLGAILNVIVAKEIYPNWRVVISVDDTVPKPIQTRLAEEGAIVIDKTDLHWEGAHRMLWRFLLADPKYGFTRMISRDADSRLTLREKWAVDQWVESGCCTHCMRDSISHMCIKMLGGMVGLMCQFPGIQDMIQKYLNLKPNRNASGQIDSFGTDQDFLNTLIWPMVQDDCLCHDSFPVAYSPGQGHIGCPHGASTDDIKTYNFTPLLEYLDP